MSERGQNYIGGCPDQDGVICWWRVGRLWELSQGLPVRVLPVAAFDDLLDRRGLLGGVSTNRELAQRARRIMEADLSHPIIVSAAGWIMDGHHRLLKAVALGMAQFRAVQFVADPEPDERGTKAALAAQGACVM